MNLIDYGICFGLLIAMFVVFAVLTNVSGDYSGALAGDQVGMDACSVGIGGSNDCWNETHYCELIRGSGESFLGRCYEK